MRVLALYAATNVHGNDAKGAFVPESIGFEKARRAAGDTVVRLPFDNANRSHAKRRESVFEALGQAATIDALAYFGHGLRTGLPSAGFSLSTLPELVDGILRATLPKRPLRIVLFACSAAGAPGKDRDRLDGDGGFADRLRDALSVAGRTGWVDAHTVPGHTTRNRYVRRFYMDGAAEGTGGAWLVAPGSPEWKWWGELLATDPAFRFGFPFLSHGEILARLASKP